MRVVAPSVGGGFGCKLNVYAEELLCVALARKHGLPVRWVETRSEASLATIQGRGQIQQIELAADADGKLQAVRVRLIGDMGAYLQLVTPGIPLLGAFLYGGVYDLPAAYEIDWHSHPRFQLIFAVRGVMTVDTREATWLVPPQRAVWMPPKTAHRIRTWG